MSDDSFITEVTAESQLPEHVRNNEIGFMAQRGWTWSQMAAEYDKAPNGALLAKWAREMAATNGDIVPGIEKRAELSGETETADAPEQTVRGGNVDVDATDAPAEVPAAE